MGNDRRNQWHHAQRSIGEADALGRIAEFCRGLCRRSKRKHEQAAALRRVARDMMAQCANMARGALRHADEHEVKVPQAIRRRVRRAEGRKVPA